MNTVPDPASAVTVNPAGPDAVTSHLSLTSNQRLIQVLFDWTEKGWLRRLDSALASFLSEVDAAATPVLLFCATVLAHVEGQGHTCLPLRTLLLSPGEVLGLPEDARDALRGVWKELPSRLSDWVDALRVSTAVQQLAWGATGKMLSATSASAAPLVLAGTVEDPVLYLRRYWNHEYRVALDILQRTAGAQSEAIVDAQRARQKLDLLFAGSTGQDADPARMDWQKFACALALRARMTVITGGPGTGKTYTAARLLALLFAMQPDPERFKIALAAPTGKAAARLRLSIDHSLEALNTGLGQGLDLARLTKRIGAARTLHSLLGASSDTRRFRFNAMHPLDIDVLIVDEASMVNLEMMSALLQALPPSAKLVLLGDKDQLDSVEAGAVLGDLCRDAIHGNYSPQTVAYAAQVAGQKVPAQFCSEDAVCSTLAQQTVMLRESKRFGAAIGELARAVNAGDAAQARRVLRANPRGAVHECPDPTVRTALQVAVAGRPGAGSSYANYLAQLNDGRPAANATESVHNEWVRSVLSAFDQFRILCAVNEGDWGTRALNRAVRQALLSEGMLHGRHEWYVGRPVMVTRNDPDLGVFNGDVGVVLPSHLNPASLRAYFQDGDKQRSVSVTRLAYVETAFAMTVHKSQGSEFEHVVLVLPSGRHEYLSRELVYTGITRARTSFTLIEGQDGILDQAIRRCSSRASGLGRYFSAAVAEV